MSGEPYNIGNPNPEISVLELANRIKDISSQAVAVNVVDYPDSYPADEPNRRCPDIVKASRQLNYSPTVSLEDGLSRFLNWSTVHYSGA